MAFSAGNGARGVKIWIEGLKNIFLFIFQVYDFASVCGVGEFQKARMHIFLLLFVQEYENWSRGYVLDFWLFFLRKKIDDFTFLAIFSPFVSKLRFFIFSFAEDLWDGSKFGFRRVPLLEKVWIDVLESWVVEKLGLPIRSRIFVFVSMDGYNRSHSTCRKWG